ncbi:MATERNAL EFFECT EMBRYO ARREST 64, ROP (rho of plants) guanine nucleotide exchange factor 12 [Hibiscus trionum]|uniref:MATERNAL EFFECT EMBRYO ARREST 64, ROP (Rho of plants) guanine nucleotide exchange factor 12 n=1 Tax=Hibiscus trionum TaxID=183268 RepID=A0A9W7H911_HIBTR|nr:MATERNAL EFFECT EMBRYO ARREST 64, ROP (rho of plants) guanine nucleotide exchange factor 12 [Hibiscus trionum]
MGATKPEEAGPDEAGFEEMVAAFRAREQQLLHDKDQMKEKFAKLLLGEDMSGGGTGVSSALALSNAITNLAASVFGEQSRLEPMSPERKARWRKEMNWLLSVTDHIVELVASHQKNKDGSDMEIMVTKQRKDLLMNIPALRTLDRMLIDCLDAFKDQTEFYYLSKDAPDSERRRRDDKWWLPTVKVPQDGLSEAARRNLQVQKECVTQVLKAAMAINAQLLSEMDIPESYIESLPKNGRASLGDSIYKSITDEFFDPDHFLASMDLSSDHKILDLKNRVEASIVIWKRKMNHKDSKSWGSGVSIEKRELFEERVETILHLIKHRFPGLPQSSLDITKIEYNKDVGQAVLESYSRILESLAHTVLSRIEDVSQADFLTQGQADSNPVKEDIRPVSPRNDSESTNGMTLSDLLTWGADQNESEEQTETVAEAPRENDQRHLQKLNMLINVTHRFN